MDASNDKKWFVYIGDKHEGPFSIPEIQEKMGSGAVSTSSFVWAEGMADWKVMTDVPEFASISNSAPGASSEPAGSQDASAPVSSMDSISPAAEITASGMDPKAAAKAEKLARKEAEKHAKRQAKELKAQQKAAEKAARAAEKAAQKEAKGEARGGSSSMSRIIKIFVILGIPGGLVAAGMMGFLNPVLENPAVKAATGSLSEAIRPTLMTLVEKVPALAPFISPIPRLDDVSADDFEELKVAARTPVAEGTKFSVALSTADLLMPTFYVSSNAPDGKALKIQVVGVGDTLLNHTSFESTVNVVIDKRLGKSTAVRFPDGKPLPRGDYMIAVYEPSKTAPPAPQAAPQATPSGQPEDPAVKAAAEAAAAAAAKGKLVARKQYFLGGAKDATYSARLKEFHEKLKAKAATELNELKQFAGTLDQQLLNTTAGFGKFKGKAGKIGKPQMKGWNKLHEEWTKLDGQLSQTFQKWTPDSVSREYYFYMLYQQLQQAAQSVSALHNVHHSWFGGGVNAQQFEATLTAANQAAQDAVNQLKAKIDQAEKLPPTARGLPRREGL